MAAAMVSNLCATASAAAQPAMCVQMAYALAQLSPMRLVEGSRGLAVCSRGPSFDCNSSKVMKASIAVLFALSTA